MGADPRLRAGSPEGQGSGLRFGPFDLDLETGELWKGGAKVKLQLQPGRVLMLLASQPGRLVTREEIQREIWPEGTFVDFEQALNFCVRQIRTALGDHAQSPRYVETLPRRGYRFIAHAERIGGAAAPATPAPSASSPALDDTVPALAPVRLFPALVRTKAPRRSSLAWVWPWALAALVVAGALAVARRRADPALPVFQRVTFGRGYVGNARFGPEGQVLYSAAWEGRPMELFAVRIEGLDSRPVNAAGPRLLAVSRAGEAAFVNDEATLMRAPLEGGPAKAVLEGVTWADMSSDGALFAVARMVESRVRIEMPIGRPLGEAKSPSHLRLSPGAERLAFLEHPLRGDDRGDVVVMERDGTRRTLSSGWASAEGLAWSPDGREVWFTAARVGADAALHAVDLEGRLRTVVPALGRFILHDIAPDGRVLLERNTLRSEIRYGRLDQPEERDLSWLDLSRLVQLSDDGRYLLFVESGEGGGPEYGAYLRETTGAVPVRLGHGRPMALSPDGQWVLAIPVQQPDHLDLWPTGAGETRAIKDPGFAEYEWASFLPGGQRIVFTARMEAAERRTYVRDLAAGPPRAVTPPGIGLGTDGVSPDGRHLVASCPHEKATCLYPLEGGEPRKVEVGERVVVGWAAPGVLLLRERPRLPARLHRYDVATGRSEFWRELSPPDRAGVFGVHAVDLTPDAKAYAYSYARMFSDLYVVSGLR
jgi:eukaryotic-like serine/threonine-protein kinase